ncbi:MAG TPA: MFS transporter [Steroidobacteraceae bacterium]|nr:MFS transporter [Steroidobacteraceae bacterium]
MSGSDVSAIKAPAEAVGAASTMARRGWYTVYMTGIVAIMSQVDRGILALFVQPMKRDFGLSDTEVSILLGFAFTFFYVVAGPPLSRMADRGIRKSVISGCLAVWSTATALCGVAQSFWAFFCARAVIGGSESGCGPASLSMIADAVPRERLPRAYAIYNSGFLGGQALSLVIGGVLIGLLASVAPIDVPGLGRIYNWQLVFMMVGIPGLLVAAIFYTTVPEPPRKGGSKPGGYPLREVFGFVVGQRALHLPLIIGVLLMSFQNYGLNAWMPAFYERTYGWGPAVIGPLLGLFTLACSTLGLFAGARLAELLGKRYDDANLRVLFLAQSLPVPLFVIAPLMPTPWLALGCNAVAGFLSVMGGPAYNAALNIATPNEMRGQINVMYFIMMNAIAGSLGPTLVALVTDYVAHSEADLRYVLSGFRLVLGPLAAFFIWKAAAPYGRLYRQRVEAGD